MTAPSGPTVRPIAERQLQLDGRAFTVRLYPPIERDGEWGCDYEFVDFPARGDRDLHTMAGQDAMHALLGALYVVGVRLRAYGGVTWLGGDLGFPACPSAWADDRLCEVCGQRKHRAPEVS